MSKTKTADVPVSAKRKTVIIGGFSGMFVGFSVGWAVYHLAEKPATAAAGTLLDRMVLALRCDAVAALTLVAGLQWVAWMRGMTEAIDPMAGAETRPMQIDIKYIGNTVEQLLLFTLGTLCIATLITPDQAALLPAATAMFVLGRIAFWIGYRLNPLWRAPGMAASGVVSGAMLFYIAYRLIRLALAA